MSSAISEIRYDKKTKSLIVGFYRSKETYYYEDVPEDVAEEFKNAGSQGRYYNENIKGRY